MEEGGNCVLNLVIILYRRSINSDCKLVIGGSRFSVIVRTGVEAILLAILLNYPVSSSYSSRLD